MTTDPNTVLSGLATTFPAQLAQVASLEQTLADALGEALGGTGFVDVFSDSQGTAVLLEFAFVSTPLTVSIPGLSSFSISIGEIDEFELETAIIVDLAGATLMVFEAPVFIQCIDSGLLISVVQVGDGWQPDLDVNGERKKLTFAFSGVGFQIDSGGNISASTDLKIDLHPVQIGNSGIVLEMKGIQPCLSDEIPLPTGIPTGSRGFAIDKVDVYLPAAIKGSFAPSEITAEGLFLGTGGFTGKLSAEWSAGKAIELGGITCTLESLLFAFKQNSLVESKLSGTLTLPFFDESVAVEIGLTIDGDFTVALASTDTNGLYKLTKPGVVEMELDSIGFELKDGLFLAKLSGQITPLFGKNQGLKWPSFKVQELSIDSKGNVQLDGGWIDLPDHYGFNLYGFQVDITKFGMGRNDDGAKWLGFSGGVQLVRGLPGGASVDGLRITADEHWTPSSAKISFNGIGVELDADAFYFKGHVDYKEITGSDGSLVHRFDGDITLKLREPELEIDGTLVIGSVEGTNSTPAYNYFAIYVSVDLPTGIPLGATDFAFFGFDGLLAIDMAPDKKADEDWYAISPAASWYKTPTIGVADLDNKWKNELGSKAFGAGVECGSYSDNGFAVSGKFLFAIVFPGPLCLFQGMGNLLEKRAKLDGGDPLFRALAVLDGKADSLLLGLDAKYQYNKTTGKLIKLQGGAVAYYEFNNPDAWYIHLGVNEPREQRIQARLAGFLDANAYLMIDPHQLAMGAWVGYDQSWKVGPLHIGLEAWMEGNAVVSFHPAHLSGALWVHGAVNLEAFGFGLGLTIDARIAAEVFDPYHLLGAFDVKLKLPWPLAKVKAEAHLTLEWGPQQVAPPVPVPLKDVAIEHLKTSTKWPLTGPLFGPDYADADGFFQGATPPAETASPPTNAPIVPLDCRVSMSFAHNVNDDAKVGIVVQPLNPEFEQIGDPAKGQGPAKVRYGLKEVQLEKWNGSGWKEVAGKGGSNAALPKLFGSWAPANAVGSNGIAQNKFLVWSKSGLDHTRHSGSDWGDWFDSAHPNFPCLADPSIERTCVDFENFDPHARFPSPLTHPKRSDVHFISQAMMTDAGGAVGTTVSQPFRVNALASPVAGNLQALSAWGSVTINFDEPVNNLRIIGLAPVRRDSAVIGSFSPVGPTLSPGTGPPPIDPAAPDQLPITVLVQDENGAEFGPFTVADHIVDIAVSNIKSAIVSAEGPPEEGRDGRTFREMGTLYLVEVCAEFGAGQEATTGELDDSETADDSDPNALIRAHNVNANDCWTLEGNVLEPYTQYRLRILTTADMTGDFSATHPILQFAFFQTKGPPGLVTLDRPISLAPTAEFQTGLDDLARYVRQTIPPTVPKTGEPPLLPRPVYRGYDVSVMFNEDYVDLMYRLAGRDLALLLYDRNNKPVTDSSGRLVVPANPWVVDDQQSFNAQEGPWISRMNNCPCVKPIDLTKVPADQTLQAAHEAQILDSDTLYNARIVPTLWHEGFDQIPAATSISSGGFLGRWQAIDLAGTTPSAWSVTDGWMTQIAAVGTPASLGTVLALGNHPGLPATDLSQPPWWSDYRLSLDFKWLKNGTIGVAFRYNDPTKFYLFTINRATGLHRVRVVDGSAVTVLQSSQDNYVLNQTYHLVIEAVDSSLRIYIDDKRLLDLTDNTFANGGIALQCSGCKGAAFSDIQVHDFSSTAKSVYQFLFNSSEFVGFFDHMHSFEDECWLAQCTLSDPDLATLYSRSTPNQNTEIGDDEGRAFERLADNVLGTSANQCSQRTEITRIEQQGSANAVAFLLRTSEPIDWSRTSLSCAFATDTIPSSLAPGSVKLVAATLGAHDAKNEDVTLLARATTDLTGYRIERRDVSSTSGGDSSSGWISFYQFGNEDTVAPGTQVVINSGNPDDATPALPRVVQRFRETSGVAGALQFTTNAVDLRLVNAAGEVIHARRFLGGTTGFTTIQFQVLRKADGTAFFLFPLGLPNSSFSAATHRLTLSFRRDNTSADPQSLILSAAGQRIPEVVILDVPWPTVPAAATEQAWNVASE